MFTDRMYTIKNGVGEQLFSIFKLPPPKTWRLYVHFIFQNQTGLLKNKIVR